MAALDTLAVPQSPLGGIAQLLQALAPIFLGSGKTTQTTGQTADTTGNQTGASSGTQTGTTSGTTTSSASPDVIQALMAQMNQATGQSTDQSAVNAIINNIIKLNAEAFTPTIGSQNEAGLYNSSTLALLSAEAQARSTAQAASAALNYRTTEQQIAGNLGATLANATKTTSNTGNTAQQNTGNTTQSSTGATTSQGTTSTQTGPVVGNSGMQNLLLGALGLGGNFLFNKLGGSDLLSSIFGGGNNANDGTIPSDLIGADGNPILPPTPPDTVPSLIANPNDVVPATAATGATSPVVAAPQVSFNAPVDAGTPVGIGAGALPADELSNSGISIAPTAADLTNVTSVAAPSVAGNLAPVDLPIPPMPPDLSSAAASIDPAIEASSISPNDVSGGAIDASGAIDTSSFLGGGISNFLQNDLGLPDWLTSNSGSVFNLPSDIGNLFDGIEGAGASVLGDVAGAGAGLVGGIGGSLVNKAIGGKATGGEIGSTVGGMAGSVFGPIGSLVGSFLGSLIGGRFGPKPPSTYSSTRLTVNGDGTLSVGPQSSQADANAGSQYQLYQQQVTGLNNLLTKTGLKVSNPTGTLSGPGLNSPLNNTLAMPDDNGFIQLGDNTPGGFQDPTKFSDLTTLFPKLQFSSDDAKLNALVSGQSFAGIQNLYNTISTGQLDTGMSSNSSSSSNPASSGIVAPTATGNTSSSGISVGGQGVSFDSSGFSQSDQEIEDAIAAGANPVNSGGGG